MALVIRLPGLGRFIATKDKGGSVFLAREQFQTTLRAEIRKNGKLVHVADLGSGVITNLAADFMAQGIFRAFAPVPNYHQTGTGAAGGASNVGQVTDTNLTTPIGTTATAGTLSHPGAAQVQSVSPAMAFGSAATVTEWGLFTAAGGSGSAVASMPGTPSAATDLLFDHRGGFSFSVDTSTTITWTWTLTFTAGG